MRLKKLLPLTLSASLLMLPVTAGESETTSGSFALTRIEPSATYSGELVLEIVEAVKTAALQEIEAAYEDGYKQGLLEVAPDAAGLEALNKSLGEELSACKKRRWRDVLAAGAGGFVLGAVAGFVVMAVN